MIPWIDAAKLKADLDQWIPEIERLDGFLTEGAPEINHVLDVLKALADNDTILGAVVQEINTLSGATKPAA